MSAKANARWWHALAAGLVLFGGCAHEVRTPREAAALCDAQDVPAALERTIDALFDAVSFPPDRHRQWAI